MFHFRAFFNKRNVLAMLIFVCLGLIALQIPFTNIVGSKTKFTLFDFFGPIAGGLIGTLPGMVAIFFMKGINFLYGLFRGVQTANAGAIIGFFPVLFAAWYFGKKNVFNLIVPACAMLAFWAHPIGREAWVYHPSWLLPLVC